MLAKKTSLLSLALTLALSGAALAQDAGGDPFDRAMQGAPPSGVQVGSPRIPSPPPESGPAGDAAPRATAPAPAAGALAPASPASGPAGPAAGSESDQAEINANYDETMKIYGRILKAQSDETGSVDRRIKSNEEIVTRYKPELLKAEDELRRFQVEFMGKAFQLRAQRDAGQLAPDAFDKAIAQEEGKFNRRKAAIAGDVAFYREEVAGAEKRLAELRAQKRTVEERVAKENAGKPKPKKPGEAYMEDMSSKLDQLGPFSTKWTMDGARFDASDLLPVDSYPKK